MAHKLLIANWKMHLSLPQAQALATATAEGAAPAHAAGAPPLVLAVPFPYLVPVRQATAGHAQVYLGAQTVSPHAQGAYTGQVGAPMLASVGATYCLVGHSERRLHNHEGAAELNAQLFRLHEAGLIPVFCVGETLAQRQASQTEAVVLGQLAEGLAGYLDADDQPPLVLAYEPVWAIGTGQRATATEAQAVHATIRQWLHTAYGAARAQATPILYGGSVKPEGAAELFAQPDVDGGLVGGASLVAQDLVAILQALHQA